MKKANKRENQSEPKDNPKTPEETNSNPLSYPFFPPAEALLGSLLPLSLGIVGTDISPGDNVGACSVGEGWWVGNKEREQ